MRIAIGADDTGELIDALRDHLRAAGHEVLEPVPIGTAWPDVGLAVGEMVADGSADAGVVCCWTGTGVSIAANKVAGVRAALCADAETATGRAAGTTPTCSPWRWPARQPDHGRAIVDAFLAGTPDDDERPNFSRLP